MTMARTVAQKFIGYHLLALMRKEDVLMVQILEQDDAPPSERKDRPKSVGNEFVSSQTSTTVPL
jgi:hypothetical protein